MITAIILARSGSSRFPKKHFGKIGNKRLIDINIETIKKNKFIKQIILATGKKKDNRIFQKLKKKFNFLKIYYHKNDHNVTERVHNVIKKIDTPFTLLVSGDCCLIDNSFIKRLYDQLSKSNYDFIKSKKKLVHEGFSLIRSSVWSKIFELSKKNYQKEHPGFVINEYKEKFKVGRYKYQKYEVGKKFRISVDTISDFDFFNYIYDILKKSKKNFNLKNVLKLKKIHILNDHVFQRLPNPKKINKISIITSFSKFSGLGHFKRSIILLRELLESTHSDVNIYCLGKKVNNFLFYKNRIFFVKKISKELIQESDKVIIDLPKEEMLKIKNKIVDNKKIFIIDNFFKGFKNIRFIIPSIKKFNSKNQNVYSGKNYLILSRDIIYEKLIKNKIYKEELLIISGSKYIDNNILHLIKKNKKIEILVGSLVTKKELKILKSTGNKIILNPKNLFSIIKNYKKIYCKFGLTALEIIALGKKPVILDYNRNHQTSIDVNYLVKKKLVTKIDNINNLNIAPSLNLNINKCLKNITNIIQQ